MMRRRLAAVLATVTIINFVGGVFVYNGSAHSLSIDGALPAGASVSYTGNGQTEAGKYTVTALIDGGNNYKDQTLTAELTVTQTAITGVTFTDGTFFVLRY